MKKLSYLIVLALTLSLLFTGCSFFNYTVQEALIDTVKVYPNGTFYDSSASLEADAKYSLRPEGFFNTGPGPKWISGDVLPAPWTHNLELLVNGNSQTWGSFNPVHTYSIEYVGTGSPVNFNILDGWYGDNSGSLTVDIYWMP